jgi:hypothetical protein
MSALCHVWTAPTWQELSSRLQHWSVQPCVRPVRAAHGAAGHNALHGSIERSRHRCRGGCHFSKRTFPHSLDYLISPGEQHFGTHSRRRVASLRIGRIFTRQPRSLGMAKGTVKLFNPTKGYGFIQPAGGVGRMFSFTSRPLKRPA